MLIILIIVRIGAQTTTNTCSNDPLVYKLDIRQRILDLGMDRTISDLNLPQLCYETRSYDYIWLAQLWTPSKYNYNNYLNIQQAQDYRNFESIKEYEFDPQLGTVLEFTNFIKGFRAICIHAKFLGEFSFYIGQDSSLLQNKTRFLKRPQEISYNDQNERYDDKGLVWAVNSQGKTIPYTAVWNYFQYSIFMDIKDILENKIISQYKLDGIVFLQPSLGLFEFSYSFYPSEIDFYGDPKFMKDFYSNYKDSKAKFYCIGDVDNINSKYPLLVAGLQQIFNPNPSQNTWTRNNYTFNQSSEFCQKSIEVTELYAITQTSGYLRYCLLHQPMSYGKQCIKFNFTNNWDNQAGIANYQVFKKIGFTHTKTFESKDIFSMSANGKKNNDPGVGFSINKYDILEIQFDGSTNELIFRKANTSIFRYQQLDISYDQYRFAFGLANAQTNIQIAFPFQFTNNLKSTYLQKNGDLHIQAIKNSSILQIGQVLQSVNQYENETSLNVYALSIPASSVIALGLCNKDIIIMNNHQMISNVNNGGYLLLSNGSFMHSSDRSYDNQQSQRFTQGNIITISFQLSNYSATFKKNQIYITSMFIGQFVKNLHFCVGFYQELQSINLQY